MLTLKQAINTVCRTIQACLAILLLLTSTLACSQPRTFTFAFVVMTTPGEEAAPQDVRLTRWLPMTDVALPEPAPMPQALQDAQRALTAHGFQPLSEGSYTLSFQGGPRNVPLLDTHGTTVGKVRITLDRFFDTSWRMLPVAAVPNGLEHQRRTRTGLLNLLDQPRCTVLFGFWPPTSSISAQPE